MKKNFQLIILGLILSIAANAQSLANKKSKGINHKKEQNFYSVQKAFNTYWEQKEEQEREKENKNVKRNNDKEEEDGELMQFKREENFLKQRVYPTGNFNPEILITEYNKYKANHQQQKSLNDRSSGNWSYMGPTNVPANGGGAGRINCVVFHPTNPNILFVGAACGGLWKSIDGGNTWTSTTDLLPALSISDVCIDPTNPLVMYLATGDKYGYFAGYGFWGGTYSAGLMKSTDGGATWNATSLNFAQTDASIIQHISINSSNTNILVAATNAGIFRSTDAGTTWNNVLPGIFTDLNPNPLNSNVLYASDRSTVYKSGDAGNSWNSVLTTASSNYSRTRVSLATTKADTNVVYVWSDDTTGTNQNFFKSINGGQTFNLMSSPDGNASPYGYYDRVLTASPIDPNVVYTGGLYIATSIDGGNSWTTTNGNIHPDNHDLEFLPNSGSTLFSCNDGGIFKSTDAGTTWNDLSSGLNIKQYYRLTCSANDPTLMYAGAQDNGTDQINNTLTTWVNGGDGMDCAIDYTNDNAVYASYQYGAFSKSTDGGATFNDVSPSGQGGTGEWTTPIAISPLDNQTIYIGYTDLYKSTDGGTSWNNISSGILGTTIYSINLSSTDANVIYMASYTNIFKTIDGGINWTDVTHNLPVSNATITQIVSDPSNSNNVCVTFSGYAAGDKVYRSTDGGANWTNISGTLPNIPVNCAVWQNTGLNSIYIGTDFGVFYWDNNANDWTSYNSGLPNVIVNDLEIQIATSKLRAATFGRGIWETDLDTVVQFTVDAGALLILNPNSTNHYCGNTISLAPSIRIKNYGQDTLHSFTLNYTIDGGTANTYPWLGTLAPAATTDIILASMVFTPGSHTLVTYTTNPNGTIDNNASNDSRTIHFQVNGSGSTLPVVEGFESSLLPPIGWTFQGTTLFSNATTTGGFGNSNNALQADCSFYDSIPAYFISPPLDFSNAIAPVTFDFSVAYAQYYDTITYIDSLIVEVSTDCGASYTPIYHKAGTSLATAPIDNAGNFIPVSNQWRAETINLDQLIGQMSIFVRFKVVSGYGDNLFIDDINIHGMINTSVEQESDLQTIKVYPNPAHDQLTILGIQISTNEKITTEIYNSLGQKVFEGVLTKNKVDIHTYKTGAYVIKMATSKGVITRKFIKQ
jgi:photosystem II stability/assembly factor-like uncharacterized protein